MAKPTYQEYKKNQLPHLSPSPGVNITILSGTSHGITSPISTRTPTIWIEVKMEEGSMFEQDIPLDYTSFIYTITGSAKYGDFYMSEPHHVLTMNNNGTMITIEALSNNTHFFIIAAQPLHEPMVQLGPFVSNTKEEIYQAFKDYQHGKNGFEGAPEWVSLTD